MPESYKRRVRLYALFMLGQSCSRGAGMHRHRAGLGEAQAGGFHFYRIQTRKRRTRFGTDLAMPVSGLNARRTQHNVASLLAALC